MRTQEPTKSLHPEILKGKIWEDSIPWSPRTEQGWLNDAMMKLGACAEEAKEEGIEVPSNLAIKKAENVLKRLSGFEKPQPDVYPMRGVEGSDVVIDLQNPDKETSVVMVIENDGTSVLYFQENKKETYKLFTNEEEMLDHLKEIRLHESDPSCGLSRSPHVTGT